jgi:hypothetical protein
MTDVALDRQLAHAYLDKLPADQVAAIRKLLEGMLDRNVALFEGKEDAATNEVLGDLGLTLSELERMSLN